MAGWGKDISAASAYINILADSSHCGGGHEFAPHHQQKDLCAVKGQ